jgi:hypothetical protein
MVKISGSVGAVASMQKDANNSSALVHLTTVAKIVDSFATTHSEKNDVPRLIAAKISLLVLRCGVGTIGSVPPQ